MLSTKDGKMIILSSPSGAGKTTLVKKISKQKNYKISISHTTREPRANEIDGVDYFFISENDFQKLIKKNAFLEYEKVHGNYYGTPINPIEDSMKFNHSVLLDIDVKGAYNIINTNHFDCISFFIRPPSIDILKERLIDRNDMSLEEVESRIIEAKNEIIKSIHFDHLIVNEDFEECYKEVEKILVSF